jgi:hypothetical protein
VSDRPPERSEPGTDRRRGTTMLRAASRRVVLVLLGVTVGLVAVVALVSVVLGGAGEERGESLNWAAQPRLLTPATLPDDRILSGRIRNTSLRRVRIEARDIRIETASGEQVEATATFTAGFLHGLYPPTRQPGRLSESELRRLGRLAIIEPRQTVPVTLAWRLEHGKPGPVRVNYGQGSLPVPR